jgi:hypothetical protein
MVKIASAKRPKDSSVRQRLERLWKEFKSVCEAIDAAAADGKPVAALLRKQEKLRARSWALADQGENERLALAERAVGGALRQGNKPKAIGEDF